MNRLSKWALAATIATYVLIFVGGLVRVSGAGLGCPDWPKCFERWIPPTDVSQLPSHIDPATFNVTLAWIEYVNRLVGVTIGIFIFVTALLAIRHARRYPRIIYPALAALVLVAIEGWQGGQVVGSKLAPFVVTIHMVLAFVIASLLTYTTLQSYQVASGAVIATRPKPVAWRRWLGMLWSVAIVSIALGTQVRSRIETYMADHPLSDSLTVLANVGWPHIGHLIVGGIVVLTTWYAGLRILSQRDEWTSKLVPPSAWALMAIAAAQVAVGIILVAGELPALLRIFHLWLSSFYVGALVILHFALGHEGEEHMSEEKRLPGRIVILAFVGLLVIALVGTFVIREANKSHLVLPVLGDVPSFVFTAAHTDAPFGNDQLSGKISVIDFIFTRCPGVCPVMADKMSDLYRRFERHENVQFISVTVDPDYDSLHVLRTYAEAQGVTDDRWLFLRGPIDEVVALAEGGLKLPMGDLPGGHSSKFVLIDNKGQIRGYYNSQDDEGPLELQHHLRALSGALK